MLKHLPQHNLRKKLSFPSDLRCRMSHTLNSRRPLGRRLAFPRSFSLPVRQRHPRGRRGRPACADAGRSSWLPAPPSWLSRFCVFIVPSERANHHASLREQRGPECFCRERTAAGAGRSRAGTRGVSPCAPACSCGHRALRWGRHISCWAGSTQAEAQTDGFSETAEY